MNGKLTALNKFINQLKELNNWVIEKKSEAGEINQKSFSERKLATAQLHVFFCFLCNLNNSFFKIIFIF